ncbi:hypothetical protein M885DRAFT_527947 [Pelagophyceae sp. CCMP2097]|nr:hypothetical protein M885DRAFT_527947 [Pelagophyceae sp. CCMP2097]
MSGLKTQLQKRTYAAREDTPVETAVKADWQEANALLQRLASDHDAVLHAPELDGAVFCGHLVADLDSIAGALGAAHLYGGTPARASAINAETEFALAKWGFKLDDLPLIDDVVKADPATRVCLVDFQQRTQLNPCIREDVIVGIIDHHALQSATIVTSRPIFVDIRPWGSMSTIVAHSFIVQGKALPKKIGGMLLCAILSDTLNLRSPTTTVWDRKVVSLLVQYCGVFDVNLLCTEQFKAKSKNLADLSADTLTSGDLKRFNFGSETVAFSVIETTDADAMLRRVGEILPEMLRVKAELAVQLIFVAVVDIVALQAHLVVCGPGEKSLAEAAGFRGAPLADRVAELAGDAASALVALAPGRVSRKADFIPPITAAFDAGWTAAAAADAAPAADAGADSLKRPRSAPPPVAA